MLGRRRELTGAHSEVALLVQIDKNVERELLNHRMLSGGSPLVLHDLACDVCPALIVLGHARDL